MITLLDKQGKEIQEQDKIMEQLEELYSELYDSDQTVTIQTDPEEVPSIMAREEGEAALRKMKNWKEGIRLSTNPSNIDIIARTRNRRCVHRNPERHIYGQLSDSTSAQIE